jgi:SAM-dependent methyltransferase
MLATTRSRAHWTTVFAAALRGEPCRLHGVRRRPVRLKVAAWQAAADSSDLALLAHCIGPTLDIGCGPGRLTEALALTGRLVLGIDVVPEAIRQARFRGIEVLLRDVFEPLPGEGRWNSALLADGNIGIGGNAVALLRRVHGLLAPDGAVVVDLAPPGTGATTRSVRLECAGWFLGELSVGGGRAGVGRPPGGPGGVHGGRPLPRRAPFVRGPGENGPP